MRSSWVCQRPCNFLFLRLVGPPQGQRRQLSHTQNLLDVVAPCFSITMSSTLSFLRDSVNDPQFHELFSIIKGFRNGLVLGAKLRLPHALVMSIIHGRGRSVFFTFPSYMLSYHSSLAQRARSIYRATKDHSVGLAQFVALYKLFLFAQMRANGGKETNAATFIAGLIAGWIVFHDQTIVREQV